MPGVVLEAGARSGPGSSGMPSGPSDVGGGAAMLLSVFLRNPQFQGQTKERLASSEATRLVENAVRDHFDHWLGADPATSRALLDRIAEVLACLLDLVPQRLGLVGRVR